MQRLTSSLDEKPQRPSTVFGLFFVYAVALLLLVGHKPLWLDEIWQQLGTRDVSFAQMVSYAQQGAGGALIPHFCQWLVLKLFPYGPVISRIPALLFGAGAAVVFWRVARKCKLKLPEMAMAIFLVLPILFRYTLEARPYSTALFFCCLGLLLLLKIDDRFSAGRGTLLLLASAAVLYSQPFAIFGLAAAAFTLAMVSPDRVEKLLTLFLPVAASFLLFLPWYLAASKHWANGIEATVPVTVFDAKFPLRILREYTGGGYVAGVCLVVLVAFGVRTYAHRRLTYMLVAGFVAALLIPLFAEQELHYFYAARHIMLALPFGIPLAASSLQQSGPNQVIARVAFVALLIASVATIATKETSPHENWQLLADKLYALNEEGNCIVSAKSDGLTYLKFFQPSLNSRHCRPPNKSLVLVGDPYTPGAIYQAKLRNLEQSGYGVTRTESVGLFRLAYLVLL